MIKKAKLLRTAAIFLLPIALFPVVPDDEEYFIAKTQYGAIIYARGDENLSQSAAASWRFLRERYDKEFGYDLDEPTLILASSKNQFANAWAGSTPLLSMQYYGGGAGMLDYFGYVDWMEMLLAHEGAHLYQLDSKNEVMYELFGRNHMPLFAGIPLWTFPNLFLPDLFLEGNAVFNETRVTGWGRLNGGRHKALFLVLLKANLLDTERALNNHIFFPYMEEKYIVGGYFQAYLASQYGADRVNGFFRTNGNRFINPFLLNKSFYQHFGADFNTLFDRFINSHRADADLFVLQKGESVSKSQIDAPLGGDENALFIYESDGKTFADILILDRQTLKIKRVRGSFSRGKPFCFEGECFTAAALYTSAETIETSLFDRDREPLKSFNGKAINDISGKRTLYLKTNESFKKAVLYDQNRRIGEVVSYALYGYDGAVYSVRYEEGSRVFYRGGDRLFSIKTEAFLNDVLPNGDLLFTAPTFNGNGLFIFSEGGLLRLGNGDNVIGAKWVRENLYLLQTVTADGYETLLARLEKNKDKPTRLNYGGEEALDFANLTDETLDAVPYNAFANLRFSYFYPSIGFSDAGMIGSADFLFVDPLEFNTLTLSYAHNADGEEIGRAGYENRRYRLFYGAQGYFSPDNDSGDKDKRKFGTDIHIGYLIDRDNVSQISAIARKLFDPNDRDNAPLIASIRYDYALYYPLAPENETGVSLSIGGRHNERKSEREFSYGAKAEARQRLFSQLYFLLGAKYSRSDSYYVLLEESPADIADEINFELLRLPYRYRTDRIVGCKAALSAAIDMPVYSSVIPIGLHRIKPSVAYERLELGEIKYLIEEKSATVEFDMLFTHRFDFSLRAAYVHNSETSDSWIVTLAAGF
ncbi:MAG: hypothetical protein LBT81_03550 [Helicobacteraceae bacterium]|nr:hypothetical protein [Helicobacteraceae bacterium]